MEMNSMIVLQAQNQYRIFTPQQILVAEIAMPPDGAFVFDAKALEFLTKALAVRWGVIKKK